MKISQNSIREFNQHEIWNRVDPLAANSSVSEAVAHQQTLPYNDLLGPGFERLCYELLIAEGKNPRFFGRSGQRDYEADIVVEDGDTRTIYQCKNLKDCPSKSEIRKTVEKFESEWIIEEDLPKPTEYIYCCPQPFNDIKFNKWWIKFREEFKLRTGVDLQFHDRAHFDSSLKSLPDLVAGLFTDSHAKLFCQFSDWPEDPWVRIALGVAHHDVIHRFLDLHEKGLVFVDEEIEDWFTDALYRSQTILIRGIPGSGKTTTGMELILRLKRPVRRIYYRTIKDGFDIDRMQHSIRHRANLPSVFVLDDCHLNFNAVENLVERLRPKLHTDHQKIVLMLLARHTSSNDTKDETDDSELVERLKSEDLCRDFKTGHNVTLRVVEHIRPDLIGLPEPQIERLYYITGGDLFLLDEALQTIHGPKEIDDLTPKELYKYARRQYFKGNRILPTIRRLACLAQFDLTPFASYFDGEWNNDEWSLADPLMAIVFAPPRYRFLHSSLAELLFRAQVALEAKEDDEAAVKLASNEIIDYFVKFDSMIAEPGFSAELMVEDIKQVIQSHLNLFEMNAELNLKIHFLTNNSIHKIIYKYLDAVSFSTLGICLLILSNAEEDKKALYIHLVREKFKRLFVKGVRPEDIISIGSGFLSLCRDATSYLEEIEDLFRVNKFLDLIMTHGTLSELSRILQHATPSFTAEVLEVFNAEQADKLIKKTIAAGRSIGGLDQSMRELGKLDPDKDLLKRLEQRIGADRYLDLILANGTLIELFHIFQYATPAFGGEMLEAFNAEQADKLIKKTIAAGRSIGTLHLSMRELGKLDPDKDLLKRLEQRIGADRYLDLILANGTLIELFHIFQYATPAFGGEMLEAFNAEQADKLIKKTIAAGRSIGTLHLSMRELGKLDPDKDLLKRLEQRIGADRYLDLILANGTLIELFHIFQYATPAFGGEMLEAFNAEQADKLIKKTIAAGRSIGTLHLSMRELGKLDPDKDLLKRLEQRIGADRYLDLILANGTLFELFDFFQYATPAFVDEMLDELSEDEIKQLVDSVVASGRSIESLHYRLKYFGSMPHRLKKLEHLVGIDQWWRLILNNGTLNSITQLRNSMSHDFQSSFSNAAAQLSVDELSQLILTSHFRNACQFLMEELSYYPQHAQKAFRKALNTSAHELAANSSWYDLNTTTLPENTEMPESAALIEAFRQRLTSTTLDDLSELSVHEAVNAIALLWRERIKFRNELASHIWEILPKPAHWQQEKGRKIASIRFILNIARFEPVAKKDVIRLLDAIRKPWSMNTYRDIHTLPLFLLFWNLAALWYERSPEKDFRSLLPLETRNYLIKILRERLRPRLSNEEKRSILALAGLICFLNPEEKLRLQSVLRRKLTGLNYLHDEAMQLTFIPAFFILFGMSLLRKSSINFPSSICKRLLEMAESYEDRGSAIDVLRLKVNRLESMK